MAKRYIYKPVHFYTLEEDKKFREFIREDLEEQGLLERDCRCGCGKYRLSEKEIEELVDARYYEEDALSYDDAKGNLGGNRKRIAGELVAFGTCGTWRVDRQGYKFLGNALEDILGNFGGDCAEIYVDDDMDVHYTAVHHDGGNRGVIRYLSNTEKDELEDALCKCKNTAEWEGVMEKYTKPLGYEIQNIYGWGELPEGFESDVYDLPEYCRKSA